ncbi:MAG: hypothetical protein RLY69_825 [Verrucomicrobiota bacterium]
MRLSIVIINWHSRDHLEKCLHALRGQRLGSESEIVVVDSASYDGSEEMIEKKFLEVHYIQSPENIGYGRCCNLGARIARGKYLLILNPDTELRPGAACAMMAALDSRPEIGLAGARLIDPDGTFQHSSTHPLPGIFNTVFDCFFIRKITWRASGRSKRKKPFSVPAVSGACMMMRTSLFRGIGGFNPRFFMYGEDIDLCQRVREAGYLVCHVPTAEVVHHGGVSSAQRSSEFSQVMIREAVDVLLRMHRGKFAAFCCRGLMALSAIVRISLASLVYVFSSKSIRSRLDGVIAKWRLVFRWCCGAEKWASHHFASTPRRVICNA